MLCVFVCVYDSVRVETQENPAERNLYWMIQFTSTAEGGQSGTFMYCGEKYMWC